MWFRLQVLFNLRGIGKMVNEKEARLPKWAQTELMRLRNNLSAAEKRIATLIGEVEPEHGTVVLLDYVGEDKNLGGKRIGFFGIDLEFHVQRGGVLVHSNSSQVYTHSSASNAVYVFTSDQMEGIAMPAIEWCKKYGGQK
jgi:hypothetical protein